MRQILLLGSVLFLTITSQAQGSYPYSVEIKPVTINQMPELHSFAYGVKDGNWILVGGRTDGIHARQPNSAFPVNSNNTRIYVVNPSSGTVQSFSTANFSSLLSEHLQATNLNFIHDESTLYLMGGYGYSPTTGNHKTYSYLTMADMGCVIDSISKSVSPEPCFKSINHSDFAVTGGQMAIEDDTLILFGGHRFDGRYNPMGHATYSQTYTEQIRRFVVDASVPSAQWVDTITNQLHLHRRDYNMLPQVFSDGSFGYTLFSGVFQHNQDLPFLYPVDYRMGGIQPRTNFNQYLSQYHSAKTCFYDSTDNSMHNVFFGGLSQYSYDNNTLVKDDYVPFVQTVSVVHRSANDSLTEIELPVRMPDRLGASAEFIPYEEGAYTSHGVTLIGTASPDTIFLGHIVGGLKSTEDNPFSANRTSATSASNTVFSVRLIRSGSGSVQAAKVVPDFKLGPNPLTDGGLSLYFDSATSRTIEFYLINMAGQLVWQTTTRSDQKDVVINIPDHLANGLYESVISLDYEYFSTNELMIAR